MLLQKVGAKKLRKKIKFLIILKVTDENTRIRICTKMSRIRNTASKFCGWSVPHYKTVKTILQEKVVIFVTLLKIFLRPYGFTLF
jgi:hypothetical protein